MRVGDRISERIATRPPPMPALRALLRTRRRLRRMREAPLPAAVTLIERSFAFIECRALGIAAELDLAGLLDTGPRSTDELAQATSTDPDALGRLLEVLAATDVFRRRADDRWENTRLSEVLRDDDPSSMRGWARFFGGSEMFGIWSEAEQSVRTGGSATASATGHDFFDLVHSERPQVGERFDDAMRDGARLLARSFVEVVDLDGVASVCDVGGGTGTLLRAILERHPQMTGTLFDLPEVVGRAGTALGPEIEDRVELIGGSFFDAVPSAERIVLVSIVHDWDDERAVEILRSCRDALGVGGRVLVVEPTLDPDRLPFIERSSDLLMLVLTGAGRERTRADFERLFDASGLAVTRTWLLSSMQTVYELEAS